MEAPGLRLDIPQKYLKVIGPRDQGLPIQSGVCVQIIKGPHKGLQGYVHFTGYFEEARVRIGNKSDWDLYDQETARMIEQHNAAIDAAARKQAEPQEK